MEFVWKDWQQPQKASVNVANFWGLDLDSRPPAGKYSGVSFFVIETDKPIFIVKHVFGSKNLQNTSERL